MKVFLSKLLLKKENGILKELPNFLELLSILLKCGVEFSIGLLKIYRLNIFSNLGHELKLILIDLKQGLGKEDSLKRFYQRNPQDDLGSLIYIIINSLHSGASLSNVLKTQAEQLRQKEVFILEKQIQKLPFKILIPLLLFFFPATLIIIFTPLILSFIESGILN